MSAVHLSASTEKAVTILLATRNGATYLGQQLQSIAGQEGCDWRLIASDDGSEDRTRGIIEDFAKAQGDGRVRQLLGPGMGVTANFRYLLSQAPSGTAVAYCDQDDIWQADKLRRALTALEKVPEGTPALYGSTVRPVDSVGKPLGEARSRVPGRPLWLRNALVQNVYQGNTIVLNAAAVRLLQGAEGPIRAAGASYVLHDWWAYILVSAAGGTLIFDPVPGVFYRQHAGNLIGMNDGLRAGIGRIWGLLAGRNAEWLDMHLRALSCLDAQLTPASRKLIAMVQGARHKNFLARVAGLRRAGLYRQRRRAQLGLWFAVLTRRI